MEKREIIEGRNPVIEALKSDREIEKLLIAKGSNQGSVKKIVAMAQNNNIVIQYVDKNKLDSISTTNSHQGVIALVSSYKYKTIEEILEIAYSRNEEPFIIILDEITDPHNFGSIIRTAECAGAHGIIIPKRRSVGVTPTVAKTSAGAVEHIAIAKVSNISYTIDELKEKGIWIYGADMEGQSYHYDMDLKGPIGLVVGSEGKGIGRLIKEKCDFLLKIPMKGNVTSLNASVASAIIIYEILRQRGLGR